MDLFSDKPGNYVKKAMRDCTGKEICMEWLYHLGVPEDQIEELADKFSARCSTLYDAIYYSIFYAKKQQEIDQKLFQKEAKTLHF